MDTAMRTEILDLIKGSAGSAVKEVVEESIAKQNEAQTKAIADRFAEIELRRDTEAATKDQNHLGRYFWALAQSKGDADKAIHVAKTREDWTAGQREAVVKTLTASSFTAGGAAVPTAFASEVIEYLRPLAVVRSLNPVVVPMPTGNLTLPKLTGGATATYYGEAENAVASQATTGHLVLNAKKLITIVPISNDLLRFATPGLDAMIREDAVRAMAAKEDVAFIRSAGVSGEPKGLKYWVPSAAINTVNATVNLANVTIDLSNLILELQNSDVRMLRCGWIFSPRTVHYLMTVQNSNGYFAFRDEMLLGTLWGFPFRSTSQIPINISYTGSNESENYFADFADVVIGDAISMQVTVQDGVAYYDSSGTLTGGFSRDETVLRIVSEHDFGMRHDASVAMNPDVDWGA